MEVFRSGPLTAIATAPLPNSPHCWMLQSLHSQCFLDPPQAYRVYLPIRFRSQHLHKAPPSDRPQCTANRRSSQASLSHLHTSYLRCKLLHARLLLSGAVSRRLKLHRLNGHRLCKPLSLHPRYNLLLRHLPQPGAVNQVLSLVQSWWYRPTLHLQLNGALLRHPLERGAPLVALQRQRVLGAA